MIIYKQLTQKIKHRSQVELSILVHNNTLNSADKNSKKFIKFLSKFRIDLVDKFFTIKDFDSVDDYKINSSIRNYWVSVFNELPKVKLDGRIRLGTYKMQDFKTPSYNFDASKLSLIVRSSERFTNQIIEIIYEQE